MNSVCFVVQISVNRSLFPIHTLKVRNMSSLSFDTSQFLDIFMYVYLGVLHISEVRCRGGDVEIAQGEVESPNCLGLADVWDYEETMDKDA